MTNPLRDQLTGLFHRVHVLQLFAQFLAEAEQNHEIVGVTLIDIDRFAHLNYYFGHNYADELLKKLASLIQSTISITDVACRFGGDEFLILSPSTSPETVKAQAELIRKQAQ
jgi:diguanylate cyclase (GGDEF)-like protein